MECVQVRAGTRAPGDLAVRRGGQRHPNTGTFELGCLSEFVQ